MVGWCVRASLCTPQSHMRYEPRIVLHTSFWLYLLQMTDSMYSLYVLFVNLCYMHYLWYQLWTCGRHDECSLVRLVVLSISSACDVFPDILMIYVMFVWMGTFIRPKTKNRNFMVTFSCAIIVAHNKVTILHLVYVTLPACRVPEDRTWQSDYNFVVCC